MCISTYLHIYTYYQLSPQVEIHVINTIGYEHFNIVGYEPFNTGGYELFDITHNLQYKG